MNDENTTLKWMLVLLGTTIFVQLQDITRLLSNGSYLCGKNKHTTQGYDIMNNENKKGENSCC